MKQHTVLRRFAAWGVTVLLVSSSAIVFADPQVDEQAPTVPVTVLITELQTGLGTGQTDKEYIELFNATEAVVSLDGWQLWYMPDSRVQLDPYRVLALQDGLLLQPQTHLLLTATDYTPSDVPVAQQFEKMLSQTAGSLVLLAPGDEACTLIAQDAVAWGEGLFGAGDPVPSVPKTKDKVLSRFVEPDTGVYRNTRNNAYDFTVDSFSGSTSTESFLGTPGAQNTVPAPADEPPTEPVAAGVDFAQIVTDDACELPATDESTPVRPPQTTAPTTEPPATVLPVTSPEPSGQAAAVVYPERSKGLAAPHITELLPNPAAPYTDAADEFVELYNSNDTAFELTNFALVAGKRTYTFPTGTLLQPHAFQAFFSAETKLALSNSGGQVQLFDPYGNSIAQSDAYGAAKDGQAWALANGIWQWTTRITPNAANVIEAPAAKSKKSSIATTKKATTATAKKTTSNAQGAQDTSTAQTVAAVVPDAPLHPAALALVGVFALLYGIYEYRTDVANKLYQFRAHRAARRSLRQKPKRRRSH